MCALTAAARWPPDCCFAAIDAVRIAVEHRTPVILLSDGYLANGTEPWRLPDIDTLPVIDPAFATGPNRVDDGGEPAFWPTRARMRQQLEDAGFRVESQRIVLRVPATFVLPSVLSVAEKTG